MKLFPQQETPMDYFTKQDVLAALRKFCEGFDTYALAAKALKVTESQLSQTRNGKKAVIPARILKKLGFAEKIVYVNTSKKVAMPGVSTAALAKKVARKINRDAVTGLAETVQSSPVDDHAVIDVRAKD
jgi:hypothetical protein